MRLINATTFAVHEFLSDDSTPDFAILSHTWGDEECNLQQMNDPNVSRKLGYRKIQLCCEQALKDGFQWVWVDTCCIDKSSAAELSEAINSMFRWYRNARICYAYLADVTGATDLPQSRWFTRGWTLQELVAPETVHFYSSNWQYLGSKLDLWVCLEQITGIEEKVLTTGKFDMVSIARRMSWAAHRQTTRVEDLAYSLMGIFDVNMPLVYGEGRKAFTRLQEEITKVSDDQSLFAWGLPKKVRTMQQFLDENATTSKYQVHGLFADSPSDFTFSDSIHVLSDHQSTLPPIISNGGVRIELQVKRPAGTRAHFAVIYCTMKGKYKYYLGFPIVGWSEKWVARCGELLIIAVADLVSPKSNKPYRETSVLHIKAPPHSMPKVSPPNNILRLQRTTDDYISHYVLDDVRCSTHACYGNQNVTLSEDKDELYAIFFFEPRRDLSQAERLAANSALALKLKSARDVGYGKTSFHITAKSSKQKIKCSTSQPPFAILVGGTWRCPWIEVVLIKSEGDLDTDFRTLNTSGQLRQPYIATKSHLLSRLQQSKLRIYPPSQMHHQQHLHQQIASWHHSWRERTQKDVRARRTSNSSDILKKCEEKGGLKVHATLQLIPSNLVERNLFLFVEIRKLGEAPKSISQQDWWRFNVRDSIDTQRPK